MLHSVRNEWEMVFVDSGVNALEIMASTPFDVIVTDMRMPGMNGAELLNEVKNLYPQTMRLILSGYSDEDLILQSISATHQFIAKPCDPEILKSIVQRALDVSTTLFNPDIKKLIGRMERLPSLPALYTEIMNKLKDPDVMISDITTILSRDLGMTAKILQLVNSAFLVSRSI
jgi:YesN/AraC family two-component response regulator